MRVEGFSVEGFGVGGLDLSCWLLLVRVWGLGLAVDGIEDTGLFAEPKQSHLETLVSYKLSSRKVTTQNDLY